MAMEALVAYYRKYESAPPDFRAVVKLGTEDFAREEFKGRSTDVDDEELPMAKVLAQGARRRAQPLTFTREGTGTLFYTARLRYAADELFQEGLDNGFRIERRTRRMSKSGTRPAAAAFKAGDLVRVTLTFDLTKERRFVAVTDPLPAGFEPVESWFATTAASLAREQDDQGEQQRATGSRGGSAAASITSSATTTASSCSRRASAKAATSSPTSSAPRPPARSARRRRTRRRCTSRKCSGGTATAVDRGEAE